MTSKRTSVQRQRRLRQRQRDGMVVAPVLVGLPLVETLIALRWLDERESEDRTAIGSAIGAMLGELADARKK